jgi:hypothetical protein
MKKSTTVIIVIVIILIAGIVGALLGNALSERQRKPDPIRDDFNNEDLRRAREDISTFLIIKSMVTTINITISLLLIGLYVNIYRDIKSDFTMGLIIVMFSMLVYAITSNPLFHALFGYGLFGLGPFTMIPDLFATVALSTLLYLSLK